MGIKILLADDSVTAQNMGKKILSEAGHDVVTVSNGAAAAKKIAEVKPELVLLDVFMPGYSGLELCEKLRNAVETAKLPVLLTVGRMEPYSPQDGARVKADGVIVKPFEATDLTAAVERFAQKAKEAQEEPSGYAKTIKIPAPPGSRDDTDRESQKIAIPGAGEPRVYEQTMRLDAAQIAALLNTATPKKEEPKKKEEPTTANIPAEQLSAAAAPALAAQEFRVEPPATADFAKGESPAPFVGKELLPEAPAAAQQPPQIPSYMAQYLDQSADDADLAVTARPAVGPSAEFDAEKTIIVPKTPAPASRFPGIEELSPTIPISGELLSHRFPSEPQVPVASAEGLELTAAPAVPEVPISKESGLETMQSVEAPTVILQDPALVTDPHRATMDFPTQFGTPEPPVADLTIPAEAATAPIDDFEARLNAAMSSYEQPSTDLPLPTPTETAVDLNAGIGTELPIPADLHSELVPELPSPMQAASVEEEDEPFFATAPIGSSDLALPDPTPAMEVPAEVVPSNVVEFPASAMASAISESQYEKAIEEAAAAFDAHAPEVSATATQQIPASDSPEKVDVVPMAMATAAAASMPTVAPSHSNYDAETELAHALKAALGESAVGEAASLGEPEVEPAPPSRDANRLAAAVEKVMQRELPGLIWKIMAELDLTKR